MSAVTKVKENFIDLIKNFPSDWELSKNKYAFLKISNGKNMSDITDVLSLTINGIQIKEDLTFGKTSKSYIGHQLVKVGDLVFTPRDFDQTPILSDVSKYDGCISNLYIVDKPNNEFLPEYINYLLVDFKDRKQDSLVVEKNDAKKDDLKKKKENRKHPACKGRTKNNLDGWSCSCSWGCSCNCSCSCSSIAAAVAAAAFSCSCSHEK